jgi:hypothetical protein
MDLTDRGHYQELWKRVSRCDVIAGPIFAGPTGKNLAKNEFTIREGDKLRMEEKSGEEPVVVNQYVINLWGGANRLRMRDLLNDEAMAWFQLGKDE